MNRATDDFNIFMEETKEIGPSFMRFVMKLSKEGSLDAKTQELAYLAVLSALQMTSGIPFHVGHAKECGASLEEVKSAILVGMPLVGLRVIESLAIAIKSYPVTDNKEMS